MRISDWSSDVCSSDLFLSDGGYLPRGVPLMKHVAALPGQRVCRNGTAITVDGIAMGDALDHDRRGRPLPIWTGCRLVAEGELFLMNRQVRDSLDRRYFGPLPAHLVIGRAPLLSIHAAGNGRFVCRAATRSRSAHNIFPRPPPEKPHPHTHQ